MLLNPYTFISFILIIMRGNVVRTDPSERHFFINIEIPSNSPPLFIRERTYRPLSETDSLKNFSKEKSCHINTDIHVTIISRMKPNNGRKKCMKTFITIIASITSPGKYAAIRSMSAGKAFICILMMTLVLGSVSYIIITVEGKKITADLARKYTDEVPYYRYTADDGLVVDGKMPIIIKDDKSIILIDTSDKTDMIIQEKYSPMLREYEKGMIIGNRTIINKQNAMKTETYDLNQMNALGSFDKKDVAKVFKYWWVFMLIGLPFYLVYFFIAKTISMLIVSLFALIINAASKYGFTYSKLLVASAFALVLPVIIDIVLSAVNVNIPVFFVIYYAIAAIYLVIGLKKAHDAA
jgi:hypothetical protein